MSRSPPTGRFGRVLRLAEVEARSSAALLHARGANAAAKRAAEVLGDLRGLAARVGPMASSQDAPQAEEAWAMEQLELRLPETTAGAHVTDPLACVAYGAAWKAFHAALLRRHGPANAVAPSSSDCRYGRSARWGCSPRSSSGAPHRARTGRSSW